MKINSIILSGLILLVSCSRKDGRVTNEKDYSQYTRLAPGLGKLAQLNRNMDFWSARLHKDSSDLMAELQVASMLSKRFSYTGSIDELKTSERLYRKANLINKFGSSSTFRSLAAVCITQHQFRLAKSYLDSALAMGDDKHRTLLMISDVSLELGDHRLAKEALDKLVDQTSFEVLIRRAKFEDKVNGDLPKAISILENAATQNDVKDNADLFNWVYSNLGDFYGHAGLYKKSYNAYLAVLKNDPEYFHCLKGIAWLAFSHDRDTKAAENILNYLKSKQSLPDYDLMLASIASYKGDKQEEGARLAAFQEKALNAKYGAMYNVYLCRLYADWQKKPAVALEIAEQEVKERPTPTSYSLLSWAYYVNGDLDNSMRIAKEHVEGFSHEPDAIYRLGMIYKEAGDKDKAEKYLSIAKNSSFELGPAIQKNIEQAMN